MIKAHLISDANQFFLRFQQTRHAVRIGKAGITHAKREGDHATPAGRLPLRKILFRADRTEKPFSACRLPVEPIIPQDGWCDDPRHPDYNRHVSLPHNGTCEALWRADHSYDLCVVLGWNDAPPVSGKGSAIFLHLPPSAGYTEGCIALEETALRALLLAGLSEIIVP